MIQPGAGNFSLGFDAVPFLEYFGNIFNGTQNNSVQANFAGVNQQVLSKYFLSDNKAIRIRGRVNQDITTSRSQVSQDILPTPNPDAEVTDQQTTSMTDVRLGAGMEFRRGKGRVVGVYGAEASVLFGNTTNKYSYGNPLNQSNPNPTTTAAFGANTRTSAEGRFERLENEKSSRYLGFGANAFAGVEYFIAPKLAVGAEFTLGLDLVKNYSSKQTYEYWDTIKEDTQTRTYVAEDGNAGGSSIDLSTGNYQGSINLMFYF